MWKLFNEQRNLYHGPAAPGTLHVRNGSFPEVGIDHFQMHGAGLWVKCGNEIIDFDFFTTAYPMKDDDPLIEIDVYFALVHYESLYPNDGMTSKKWGAGVDALVDQGILKRFDTAKCCFVTDLEELLKHQK
jgi:hypothetical protein